MEIALAVDRVDFLAVTGIVTLFGVELRRNSGAKGDETIDDPVARLLLDVIFFIALDLRR